MPNKHFCQGPHCHEQTTSDRFLKSRGVVRGRYAYADLGSTWHYGSGDKFFCSQRCKMDWLELNMPNIEQGRPIEFIRHRRETGGYEKKTEEHEGWQGRTYKTHSINRVDNRTEID
jgi:hypothetical protein